MGWTDTVKKFFSRDTTGKVSELARGSSGENIMPQMGPGAPNSGMGGAYQQLSTMLSVDADLMLRYSDYENMDDYPEISCLTRDCKVAILDVPKNSTPGGDMAIAGIKWESLGSLAARREQYPDEPLYVLAIDHARRKIVPARANGPVKTGSNVPVVKVTFEEHRSSPGKEKRRWSIRCTPEHLFMLRAGHYVPAQALKAGDRLMPCSDGVGKNGYLRVRDPFFVDAHRSTIYHNIHTLVAEEFLLGGPVPVGHVVHHIDEDKTNAHPANIVVESRAAHTKIHEIVQRPEIRARIAAKITDRWADPVKKLQMSNAISAGKQRASAVRAPSTSLSGNPEPKGILSDEHRQKIAEAHTIPLAADVVRVAVQTSHSISEAARKLHVDDSTLARRMSKMGITRSELGQCVQTIHEGEAAYANHVVVSVEPDGYDDVYDIEVPEYHNFACEGVFVHNSALDIYADDATIIDAVHGRVIWATSKDKIVRDIINDLLHRRIRIEEDIWVAIRTMGKYGNIFCEVVVNEKGVLGLNWLPPPTMRRIIDGRGNLVGFVQDPSGMFAFNIATRDDLEKLRVKRDGSSAVFFYPWEVVHWRLRGKQMRALYGYSLLDSARWIWKRLIMLEDSSLVCKLTKSPSRFAFYVDTGEMPPREARAMVDEVRRRYKKKRIVDPSTGKLDFRINPMCLSLDTRIPLLNGTTRPLRDLIMDHEGGVQNYVYSMDPATKRVKPGKISWAGVTRRNARVVRVTLDNCQEIIATPDHQFLLRDGTYKQAQLLESGDSVMPLYRGINPGGYEYVVNQDHRERGPEKWKALVPVHRMVAEHFYGDLTERQVHHIDDRKRNNYPENLEALAPEEHSSRHSGEKARRMRRWNKSEAHSKQTSHYNRVYDKGQNIVAYNRSPQHEADNAVRSEKIAIKYPDGLLPELRRLVQENATLKISDAVVAMRKLPIHEEFCELNANRKKVQFDLYHARKIIHRDGHRDWQDFCASATVNHKIASVEWLDGTMDTGCITVDGWHNFAVDSGVFVKNSQDEDIFIPTRAGKEASRVEVLSGPDYDDTNVLGYFLKKLYAAIRIPPQYLGGTETTNRAALTQEDVQFARLELRIQHEFVSGLSQVVRVHLAALNIDPDSVQWDLRMPAPSSIFEMQQIEVWNARAALAAALRDFFTMPWIVANIFHMSEEDALFASEAKKNEDEATAMAQAQTQAEIMQKFPELGPMGAMGAMGVPPEGEQGQAGAYEDVRKEIRRVLAENSGSNNEVLRLLNRIEPALNRVERKVLSSNRAENARGQNRVMIAR